MFTVKHRAADGTETLYSAETVEVVRDQGQHVDGVYLDWPPLPPGTPGEAMPPRLPAKQVFAITTPYESASRVQVAGQPSGPAWIPRVWVMNDSGATVAVYDL